MADSNLLKKLSHIQTELKAPKNLFNKFGNYSYRNAEGIQEALKPFESKYGVLIILTDTIEEFAGRFYVKATATIYDTVSGENISVCAYAREAETKKGMDDAQITGATSSYARKYALNGLFLLDDTKDVDSEEYQAQGKSEANKGTTTKATPKPTPKKAAEVPFEVTDSRTELRNFINENHLDGRAIAQTCGLNPKSTEQDYAQALEYARGLVK